MRLNSGRRMNQRVEIWLRSTDVSAFGEHTESFNVTATRWAAVSATAGREFTQDVGQNTETAYQFLFRYDSVTASLTTSDRLKFGGNHYDIQSVINTDELNREIRVTAVRNERQS